MSNRKKARMDAIERRLAVLEAWQQHKWIGVPDPPEFSCQPTGPLPEMEFRSDVGLYCLADGVKPHRTMSGAVPDDVRERVRERSDLADARATERDLEGETEQAIEAMCVAIRQAKQAHADRRAEHARAARLEDSLRALMTMVAPTDRYRFERADLHALIEGCLAGGTITPEGLRDA